MSSIAGILPTFAAIIKIIADKLREENERPVNGALAVFAVARFSSDASANRPQQERRKM
jgi:hypothetical protein